MGDVTRLKIAGAPIRTKAQMVEYLRDLANRMEAGDFGEVNKLVTIIHSPQEGIIVLPEGDEHFTYHAVVGMIECGKLIYTEDR